MIRRQLDDYVIGFVNDCIAILQYDYVEEKACQHIHPLKSDGYGDHLPCKVRKAVATT